MSARRAWLPALLAVMALAPAAQAQRGCESPDGSSALDVYCESLPSASGERGNNTGAGGSLDRRISRARGDRGGDRDPSPPPAARGTADRAPRSGDVPGAVGSAIESSPDGGNGIIWVLAIVAAAMVGLAAIWRLRGSPDG